MMRLTTPLLAFALLAASVSAQTPERPASRPSGTPAEVGTPEKVGPETVETTPAAQQPARPDSKQKPESAPSVVAEPTETSVVGIDPKGAEELPQGMDPSDLAAMKSARAMLDAEKRLRKLVKEGAFKDIDRILTFEEISSWPYEDGLTGIPAGVKKLDKSKVMMIGFMLPIDEVEGIKEFLLVQSLWSCCYGQPPDINGIVRVVMKGKSRIDYQFDPIKIIGDFKVEAAYEDGYCLDIYQLHADSVEAIK